MKPSTRRTLFAFLAVMWIQACAPPAPAVTSTPAATFTPADTSTPNSTFTITPSPTIVRIPTQDPNLTPTISTVPLFVGSVTATPFATFTPSRPGAGFSRIEISLKRIYWGSCKFNNTTVTANVEDPFEVAGVIIFTRVRDFEDEDDATPWTSGNVMVNEGDGKFTYRMYGSDLEGHNHYKKSLVLFQLVAVNDRGEVVGRSRTFQEIQLSPCLCLDPSTGCPPTPRPRRTPTPTPTR